LPKRSTSCPFGAPPDGWHREARFLSPDASFTLLLPLVGFIEPPSGYAVMLKHGGDHDRVRARFGRWLTVACRPWRPVAQVSIACEVIRQFEINLWIPEKVVVVDVMIATILSFQQLSVNFQIERYLTPTSYPWKIQAVKPFREMRVFNGYLSPHSKENCWPKSRAVQHLWRLNPDCSGNPAAGIAAGAGSLSWSSHREGRLGPSSATFGVRTMPAFGWILDRDRHLSGGLTCKV